MASIVRIVISGPVNERWYATPMYDDGTAGEAQGFNTLDLARHFAAATFPRSPVRISPKRPEIPRKGQRVRLYLFD